MKLVDTVKCVYCGKSEYKVSQGKSARTLNGVCDMCLKRQSVIMELFPDEEKETVEKAESKAVQKGRAR